MPTRERMTWNQGGARNASGPTLPVERNDRRASAHPATPDEGITHPAGYEDPEQPAAYENGDTSSWAEDPTTGPYENSAHPATPDEGPFHPAAKKAARELRAAVENKAAKCIRIATSMLGRNASIASIEEQALSMMDLPDSYINQTLSRLAADEKEEDAEEEAAETVQEEVEEEAKEEKEGKEARDFSASDERLLRRLLAEEGMDDDEESDDEGSKKANDRFAGIESALANIQKELTAMRGYGMDDEVAEDEVEAQDEDEALLAMLLAEEEGDAEGQDFDEDEDEMLLSMMLEEEMSPDEEEIVEETIDEPEVMVMAEDDEMAEDEATLADYIEDTEMDLSMGDDPMNLGDDDLGDMSVLANLYTASAKKSEDDEDEDDEEDEGGSEDEDAEDEGEDEGDKEAKSDDKMEDKDKGGKKANTKPRPKKASRGARTVGSPTLDKTASGEISDLERLWKSAPDVSDAF